jgi:hypothetical protein
VIVAYLMYFTGICLAGLKKTTAILKTAGVPAEIRTENFPNTNLERYRLANPLDYITLERTCRALSNGLNNSYV